MVNEGDLEGGDNLATSNLDRITMASMRGTATPSEIIEPR